MFHKFLTICHNQHSYLGSYQDLQIQSEQHHSYDLPYAFSLALHTGEDVDNIIANRNKLANLLQSDAPLHYIVANQTHSDNIKVITQKETKGWESLSG